MSAKNAYRLLPSVEEALGREDVQAHASAVPRALLVRFVQDRLEFLRSGIRAQELDHDAVEAAVANFGAAVGERVRRERKSGVLRAVNATGVVLHTGLGRAPMHPEVADAMGRAAGGYCILEVDRMTGQRNQRDGRLSELVCRLVGGEAAIAVNNNAAAVLLTLNTFAAGRETIVSRGECVEIGGSFRMPTVMERAGTRLVEVGTTNRTRVDDFRAAVGENTGLLLKVHTSNFKVVGFTEEVESEALGSLGRELGVRTAFDVGSGRVEREDAAPLHHAGLEAEPLVAEAVASGVDVVMFSGDKLFGGPQAGILVGRREAIKELRSNAMYRALRLDKVSLAGLEHTLQLYLDGRADEVPSRAALLADPERLRSDAARLAEGIQALPGFSARVDTDGSQPGSGSAPGVLIETTVVRVRCGNLSTGALSERLRLADPPIFARIHDDELAFDLRALLPGELEEILAVMAKIAEGDGS